jgi:hypothetical protein
MNSNEIVDFVKRKIEALPATSPYGARYRVAATLSDGTYLPCVVVEGTTDRLNLAMRRFDESRHARHVSMGYESIVKVFVAKGNTVNDYDIDQLAPSPCAIPLARLLEIKGETSMGWTEFYAVMKDGAEFRFGTQFLTEFFGLPEGYGIADIVRIIPAVRGEAPRHQRIYRERPFFTCYVDDL